MQQKVSVRVGVMIIILMALTAGAFIYKVDKYDMENLYQPVRNQIKKKKDKTACTMEAKLCADGTYVSRSGPNCEFAACPGESTVDTSDWQTYRNEKYGYSFMYPNNWSIMGDNDNLPVSFVQAGYIDGQDASLSFGVSTRDFQSQVKRLEARSAQSDDYKRTEIKFLNLDAVQVTYSIYIEGNKIMDEKYIIFEKNGQTFEIGGIVKEYNTPEAGIENVVLSSFKFIN